MKLEFYQKLLLAILFIILLPVIILIFLCMAIQYPFTEIAQRREYKKSFYYKSFKVSFNKGIMQKPGYIFYNSMIEKSLDKKLGIKYVRMDDKGFEYFVYKSAVYIFPDFSGLKYVEDENTWKIVYRKYSEESINDIQRYIDIRKALIDKSDSHLPVKILLERNIIMDKDLEGKGIPASSWVVKSYESAFDNFDWRIISVIPQNAKQLYEQLLVTPDLCGTFELVNDDTLYWTYKDLVLHISANHIDVSLNWMKDKDLTHWHPDDFEIYDDVCSITKKNSVLIIKRAFGSSFVKYMGDKEKCPYVKTPKGALTFVIE